MSSLDDVRRRIRWPRRDATVRLVAVTKGFDVDVVTAALAAGVRDIGENHADELMAKAVAVDGTGSPPAATPRSALSRRRAAPAGPRPRWRRRVWQTLARPSRGVPSPGGRRRPGARLGGGERGPAATDARRAGAGPGRGAAHLDLDVRGLMVVAPPAPAEVARVCDPYLGPPGADLGLAELSMGMSDDVDVALDEGATMVRVGQAVFGPRPGAPRWRAGAHPLTAVRPVVRRRRRDDYPGGHPVAPWS